MPGHPTTQKEDFGSLLVILNDRELQSPVSIITQEAEDFLLFY